jgi:hypothetical protein
LPGGIAANHITTADASKLPRNQCVSQERAILIGLSKEETDHERKRINPPRVQPWNKRKLIGAKPPLRASHVWSIRTKL